MFTSNIMVTLVRAVVGKLSRLVYLAPRLGFGSVSVISQFLLHHNLGILSCKRYKHYFNETEMFTSNVQFGYPCLRRGGGKLSRLVYLAPHQGFGSNSVISSFLLHHYLGILVVRDINIISVKLTCLHPTFSLVTLVRGVGGKQNILKFWAGGKTNRSGHFAPHPLSIRNPTERLK